MEESESLYQHKEAAGNNASEFKFDKANPAGSVHSASEEQLSVQSVASLIIASFTNLLTASGSFVYYSIEYFVYFLMYLLLFIAIVNLIDYILGWLRFRNTFDKYQETISEIKVAILLFTIIFLCFLYEVVILATSLATLQDTFLDEILTHISRALSPG